MSARKTILALALALASLAHADTMPRATSDLLLDIRREHADLQYGNNMPREQVGKLCQWLAENVRNTYTVRRMGGSADEAKRASYQAMIDGTLDARSVRMQEAVIRYVFAQPARSEMDVAQAANTLRDATLIDCRLSMER
jgi:hypothetical protein